MKRREFFGAIVAGGLTAASVPAVCAGHATGRGGPQVWKYLPATVTLSCAVCSETLGPLRHDTRIDGKWYHMDCLTDEQRARLQRENFWRCTVDGKRVGPGWTPEELGE